MATLAIHEVDRHFLDAQTGALAGVAHLDLEGVPAGTDAAEVELAQGAGAEALEAARGVMDPQAEDQAGVNAATVTEQLAREAPRSSTLPPGI